MARNGIVAQIDGWMDILRMGKTIKLKKYKKQIKKCLVYPVTEFVFLS